MATAFAITDTWDAIHDAATRVHFEQRASPMTDYVVATLLAGPKKHEFEGPVEALALGWAALPSPLVADIAALADRFADVMRTTDIRARLEVVTTNACTRVHADYTDVRLITTYSGPGTDYAEGDDSGCCLSRIPTGWVGLFKGQLYGRGHAPCLHRSPPVAETGEARLVLVIDTPARRPGN